MDPRRFARLKEIVLTASSLPPDEMAEFVERSCAGEPDLRGEVEALLRQDEPDLELLKKTGLDRAAERALASRAAENALPEAIGPYRIRSLLGEGGMGVVYRAEQERPIRREVAIKLLRGGLDTSRVVARFESERQTLALMDHPNIARVIDAGADDAGRPYFVMELVRGVSLDRFAAGLSLGERLELFRAVCRGVEHAHLKGIIHRDLKPSNVLVTTQDGVPIPKIIDFGIAKAVEGSPVSATLTQQGQVVGTLEYMSPEQAEGRSSDADTRTDVYSLGVILHELVMGRLPYEISGLALPEAVRTIRDRPPQGAGAATRGGVRVDAEIETIVFKALEKDPDRRYQSAGALGGDLDRYARSEPILARPPSTIYQLRKLIQRNRAPFFFAAIVLGLLVAFGASSFVQLQAQRRERARAEAEADKAQQISGFLRDMLATANPWQGADPPVSEVLGRAASDLESNLAEQPAVRAALHNTIGSTYQSLARFEEAESHLRKGLALRRELYGERHPDVAESKIDLAWLLIVRDVEERDLRSADSLARDALEIHRDLFGPSHPNVAKDLSALAFIANASGRYAEAESLYRQVIRIYETELGPDDMQVGSALSDIATALFYQGKADEAEAALRDALEIYRKKRGDRHTSTASVLSDLGFLLQNRGRYAEAESLLLVSIEVNREFLSEDHPDLCKTMSTLGTNYYRQGRLDEAEEVLQRVLDIRVRALGDTNSFVGADYNNLASVLNAKGDYAEAEGLYRRALAVWRANLGPSHPNVAPSLLNLGDVVAKQGRESEAIALCREGLAIQREHLGDGHPNTAIGATNLSRLLLSEGDYAEAETLAGSALEVIRNTIGPGSIWAARASCNLGGALHQAGRLAEAETHYRAAIETQREAMQTEDVGLALYEAELGRLLHDQGRLAEAERELELSVATYERLVRDSHPKLAEARLRLADLRVSQGRMAQAARLLEASVPVMKRTYPPGHHRTALAELTLALCRADEIGPSEAADLVDRHAAAALAHAGNLESERRRARERVSEFHERSGRLDRAAQLGAIGG